MKCDLEKCESPIEKRLMSRLLPDLAADVSVTPQFGMHVRDERFEVSERYRADFLLTAGDRTVVIECDGQEFHDYNRDRERDGIMLIFGGVHYVFRFRGCDVNFYLDSCIATLNAFCPRLFDAAARFPTLVEMVSVSRLFGSAVGVKPIVRCKVPAGQAYSLTAAMDDVQTFNGQGLTPDREWYVAYFQTPYWDWRTGHRPSGTYHISEIVEEVMEDLRARRDDLSELEERF